MKDGIHPNYQPTTIRCACGAVYETRSTKQNISIEICRFSFDKRQYCIGNPRYAF